MNIGLTGGIATGKSTVSSMLTHRGAALVDADQIAREVVLPGEPALLEIAQHFGQAVMQDDGSLNRKALGKIVFADPAKRKQLENILHPRIRSLMLSRMEALEAENPHRLVVVDIPLLYESDLSHYFEQVLLVYVPPEVQLERLMKRDGLTEEEALQRIQNQMPIEKKKRLADIVIDNSGTIEETEKQVEAFLDGKRR